MENLKQLTYNPSTYCVREADIVYNSPHEVPLSLQQSIQFGYKSGLKPRHLAMIYSMPESWIITFITPQPQRLSEEKH